MEEQLGRAEIPQPGRDSRLGNPRCKICKLDEVTRNEIEEDMFAGLGVTNIVNKYPEANLNASNVYSHRSHLTSVKAKRIYEVDLYERALKTENALPPKDSEPSLHSSNDEVVVRPGHEINPTNPTTIQTRATTGNSVLDDIHILDQIIAQGEVLLNDVTVKDVLDAIRLKQSMLGNTPASEDTSKTEVTINAILAVLGNDESKVIEVESTVQES